MTRTHAQIRIALAGAHSTGKTSLLVYAQQHIDGQVLAITNIARQLISRGLLLGERSTQQSLMHYVRDQLRAERRASTAKVAAIVSDRTVLDAVGYAHANRRWPGTPELPDYFIEVLEEIAMREVHYYDIFVYFPIEFGLVADGVRPPSPEYRLEVDSQIAGALERWRVRYVGVRGSVAERYEQMMTEIRNL